MTGLMSRVLPSITTMIRMDHTAVLATFHKYRIDSAPSTKQAIANTICTALEIHAKLEEEIFYPAMRASSTDGAVLEKSVPEHNEMRRLIAELRSLHPTDAAFDTTLAKLMREVMHHVADEETILLPDAERVLADRLGELGAQMTKRRLELAAPRAGEIAINTARTMPVTMLLVGAGVVALGAWAATSRSRDNGFRRLAAAMR